MIIYIGLFIPPYISRIILLLDKSTNIIGKGVIKMAVRISSHTSIVKRSVSTAKKSNNSNSSSKGKTKSSSKAATTKATTSKSAKKGSNVKTNVATKSSKVSTASSKKVNLSSKNNTKQTTYIKDAPKLYTSSGVAYSYGRPAQSYIAQNKAGNKKNKSTTNHSTTKSNPVSLPKVTKAPIKQKTTKSSSDVVKIYQPTDSRNGAGKYSYAKKTSPTGAKEGASFVTSSLPIVGDAKDVQEAITGKDLVTGKKLSKTDRVITAAASVIPVVSGKSVNTVRKATKSPTVKSAVKSGTKKLKQSTEEIMKKAKDGIKKIGKEVTNVVKDVDKKVPSKVKDDVKIESGNNGEKVKKGGKKIVISTLGKEIDITPSSKHSSVNKNPGPYGEPNTSVDILDTDGNIKTRRWYDSEGKALRDVDMSDHGNPKEHPEVPHEHLWEYNNGKPKRN